MSLDLIGKLLVCADVILLAEGVGSSLLIVVLAIIAAVLFVLEGRVEVPALRRPQ
jgi:hypothetical protein